MFSLRSICIFYARISKLSKLSELIRCAKVSCLGIGHLSLSNYGNGYMGDMQAVLACYMH